MDEARKVIERLERIEALQQGHAPAVVLLEEVRALLREGEAWLAAEEGSADGAATVLGRCRAILAEGREVVPGNRAQALL